MTFTLILIGTDVSPKNANANFKSIAFSNFSDRFSCAFEAATH